MPNPNQRWLTWPEQQKFDPTQPKPKIFDLDPSLHKKKRKLWVYNFTDKPSPLLFHVEFHCRKQLFVVCCAIESINCTCFQLLGRVWYFSLHKKYLSNWFYIFHSCQNKLTTPFSSGLQSNLNFKLHLKQFLHLQYKLTKDSIFSLSYSRPNPLATFHIDQFL